MCPLRSTAVPIPPSTAAVGADQHNGWVDISNGDTEGPVAALNRFDPLVRDWFTAAFAEPTAAQAGAWDAIGKGEHTLVVAPTGSGKTLAAFLSAINDLVAGAPAEAAPPAARCTVLYLSPLKALAVDVERNLRSPLTGVRGDWWRTPTWAARRLSTRSTSSSSP